MRDRAMVFSAHTDFGNFTSRRATAIYYLRRYITFTDLIITTLIMNDFLVTQLTEYYCNINECAAEIRGRNDAGRVHCKCRSFDCGADAYRARAMNRRARFTRPPYIRRLILYPNIRRRMNLQNSMSVAGMLLRYVPPDIKFVSLSLPVLLQNSIVFHS